MSARDLFNKLGYSWCHENNEGIKYHNACGMGITVFRNGSIAVCSDINEDGIGISKEEFYAILVQLKEYGVTYM